MTKTLTKKQLLNALEQICCLRERSVLESFAYQGPPSRRMLKGMRDGGRENFDQGYNEALAKARKIARDALGLNE